MGNKRRIPYGVINWAKLVRGCHFEDNTGYNWFNLPEERHGK